MATDSKPLTLLKAYRIVNNLDPIKICLEATISRSYLTRLEQGAAPSPEIASRLIRAMSEKACARASDASTKIKPANTLSPTSEVAPRDRRRAARHAAILKSATDLVDRMSEKHVDFQVQGLQEIHLLYPQHYQAGAT